MQPASSRPLLPYCSDGDPAYALLRHSFVLIGNYVGFTEATIAASVGHSDGR